MIYINDALRITKVDALNLQLEHYRAYTLKNGEVKHGWKRIGYFGDLKSALLSALKNELFDCATNEMTLKEVLVKIDDGVPAMIVAPFSELAVRPYFFVLYVSRPAAIASASVTAKASPAKL